MPTGNINMSPKYPNSSVSVATGVATTVSGISLTLTPSSNNSVGTSQITFKGVDGSLHLSMTSCVLAVILGLVCEL